MQIACTLQLGLSHIIISFLSQHGDSHTKEVCSFFVVGYELNTVTITVTIYSVAKSLPNEISQKYQNSIHRFKVEKFCFLT